jgi:dihydroneopterin aldolase
MDTIAVRGIRAYGKHGANPGERDHRQPFDLDLEIDVDLARAKASDELADTIDYAAIHAAIVRTVETHSYELLERLGAVIVEGLFADERVVAARLTLAKPRLLAGATPAVTLRAANPASARPRA